MNNANVWICDGTFKTVPNLFLQLYTIHCKIGGINSRILPVAYALMTSKSQECYITLFDAIRNISAQRGYILQPAFILTDFELAPMNAARFVFPNCQPKGCFFHLMQIIYRKIQKLGLATVYGNDRNLKLSVRQMAALAFLPPNEIVDSFRNIIVDQLRNTCFRELLKWFAKSYVTGHMTNNTPPKFAPTVWSVEDNNRLAFPRTTNHVEAWHNRWNTLINASHVGIYVILQNIIDEENRTEGLIASINVGHPRPTLPRKLRDKSQSLQTLIQNRRLNQMNRSDFLRGVAHNLSM